MTDRRKLSFLSVVAFGLLACALYGVGAGIRCNVGIILNPMAVQAGLGYEDVSLCIAVMQLVFGACQPLLGIAAARTSNRSVMLFGVICLVLSMLGIMAAESFAMLMLSLGVLMGLGCGALAFGLILTSAIHFAGRENAMTISGMLNAAAGIFGFVLAPLTQALLDIGGLTLTLGAYIAFFLALIPLSFRITSRDPKRETASENVSAAQPQTALPFREAFSNRTYLLLLAGFSTCGFHMVIIESHLFSQFVGYGIEKNAASWAFSVYSIATIFGALLSGYLSSRLHKGRLLGFLYGFRSVWTLLYLFLMPKNVLTAVIFATGLGLTGDATVSPTAGLVSENFKLRHVATLIGLLFFVHQIGAFFSAWLGGVFLKMTGDYSLVWYLDAALCTFAAAMSLMIRKTPAKQ